MSRNTFPRQRLRKICSKFDVTPSYRHPLWVSESYRSRNTCCHWVVCSNPIGFENYWKFTYCRWFILFTYLHTQWQISSDSCIAPPKCLTTHVHYTVTIQLIITWKSIDITDRLNAPAQGAFRAGRGTLCLNAPFESVCENSYFYEMAHLIKCRVRFGKKMFNDCIKPHSICMWLVLSKQEEFSLKGTNPALKKPSNIPEIYAKMFGRFHWSRL